MMNCSKRMEFEAKYEVWVKYINDALSGIITENETPAKSIYSAMRYSLMAGGKRIRPVLSLAVCEMLGGKIEDILPYACAIEMIHTYSLIHDDLPAMDNDDFRRGKPTNHKVYGEARAILAGDGLLTYAFELMTGSMLDALNNGTADIDSLKRRIQAVYYIARAAGVSGMIGGQVVDIESVDMIIEPEVHEFMNRCKTGALIKAAIMVPVIITGQDKDVMDCLEKYSDSIGLAFQVKDDILDSEGSMELLGKRTGRDVQEKRSTYVTLHGLDEAKNKLDCLIREGIAGLERFGEKADFLRCLALYIKDREK